MQQVQMQLPETRSSRAGGDSGSSLGNKIYQFFFISALVTLFTLGCMWGAINLLLIGFEESFHGIDYSWVMAHGHAMIFGFVGFFIIGFSYQALPRFTGTRLWRLRLAFSVLPLMIVGILVQAYAHVITPVPRSSFSGSPRASCKSLRLPFTCWSWHEHCAG